MTSSYLDSLILRVVKVYKMESFIPLRLGSSLILKTLSIVIDLKRF